MAGRRAAFKLATHVPHLPQPEAKGWIKFPPIKMNSFTGNTFEVRRLKEEEPKWLDRTEGQAANSRLYSVCPQASYQTFLQPTWSGEPARYKYVQRNQVPEPHLENPCETKGRTRFPPIKINPFKGPTENPFEVRRLKEEQPKWLERTEAWAAHNKQYSGRLRPEARLENPFAQGIRHKEALTNLSRNKTELFQTKTGTVMPPVMPPVRPPVRLVPLQKVTRGNVHSPSR
ncbi:uncharacterized protein LOC111192756 isoform X2 [Astyanax mexicanus]|uniref:uncharacterized protein LOC111192756 isoform X2 n=1 Tax=Astyanax mexicanus TaxID=7994 RepID=UPI0020CAF150|nr:uncharacterized protein LOC111192756 isoform X2 [Astyanax mexicanus]